MPANDAQALITATKRELERQIYELKEDMLTLKRGFQTLDVEDDLGWENSWGGTTTVFQYEIFGKRFVFFEGTAAPGTDGATAFTLPEGYRPENSSLIFSNHGSGGSWNEEEGVSRIIVRSSGAVDINYSTGNAANSIGMDTIFFRALRES